MQLDLSGVIPEARPIVQAAVDVYLRHTHEWFVGLIAHGSTVKGSFIPGCSDIDLQLYLEPSAFTGDGYLPLALTLAIHYDLATINPAPFAYIQCYAHPCRLPAGQVGPIPGTYAILAGRLPIPEATAADLTRGAHDTLAAINPFLNKLTASLLEHGDGRFERFSPRPPLSRSPRHLAPSQRRSHSPPARR